jgi:hypothetical protein
MEYILLTKTQALPLMNIQNGVNVLIPTLIKCGEYINNYACSLDSQHDFEDVFQQFKPFTLVDLELSNFEKNTTPPALSPYAVEIPTEYSWVFPEDVFILNGFEIPLDTYQTLKVVNLSYFEWPEFRAELDNGNYDALKRALMPLWDYVATQVANNNIIIL